MLKLFKKKGKDSSRNNIILHNVYILYLIFIIALANFLTLVYSNDYYSASIFVLVGFLTSFFSKNMIIILFIAIAITNILKYGSSAAVEGFTAESHDKKPASTTKPAVSTTKPASTTKPTSTTKPASTTKPKSSESIFSVENKTDKEDFSQEVVYTTDEDRELAKTDKLILSQEKLLKSMNRYKPLLDTLQGITKNMAVVKGVASFSDE